MATPPASSSSKGNLFTRKIGPLSTWVWILLISAPIVLYSFYERSKNAKAAAPATSSATTSGMVSGSQVPQFVNQTYTTVEPPSAPASLPTAPVHHRQPAPAPAPPTQPTPQPTPVAATPPPVATPTPGPSGVTEPVPLVVGERANFAIGKLQSLGLGYKSTTGNRNPKATYDVSAQNPAPGTPVPQGSTVQLAFQQVQV
jgi:hypothetical protein